MPVGMPLTLQDLKSGNVMVQPNGTLKLIDFGIARLFKTGQTQDTVSLGTQGYCPPEQYGQGQTDARSDIYALGKLAWALLTGRNPAQEPGGILQLRPVHQLVPTVSPALDALIQRATALDPNQRPGSAAEFLQVLRYRPSANPGFHYQPTPPTQQVPPPVPTPPTQPAPSPTSAAHQYAPSRIGTAVLPAPQPRSRVPLRWTAVAVLLAVVLAGIGWAIGSGAIRMPSGNPAHGASNRSSATHSTATAAPSTPVFNLNSTYTYNDIIGHSKTTALTNGDVNVALNSLAFDAASGTSTLVVSFQNYDAAKGANFLFQQLTHVSMSDDRSAHYQAQSATPSELVLAPGQSGSVTVTFPLIHSDVTNLSVYFNTDYGALDTQCALLTPTKLALDCPAP
jgi:serine/threonine protein kinase